MCLGPTCETNFSMYLVGLVHGNHATVGPTSRALLVASTKTSFSLLSFLFVVLMSSFFVVVIGQFQNMSRT